MADEFVGHDDSWGNADQVRHTEYKTTAVGTIPRMEPVLEEDPGLPDSTPVAEPVVVNVANVTHPVDVEEFIGAGKDAPKETVKDVLDSVAPRYDAYKVTLIDNRTRDGKAVSKTYVQRPLSFVGKYELYAIVGDVIDRATEDVSIDQLLNQLGVAMGGGGVTGNGLNDPTQILRMAAKLLRYSPTLIQDLFCVLLDIPMDERAWAVDVMRRTPEDGGLDDEVGFEVLETAIDQNAEKIEDFFVKKGGALVARAKLRLGTRAKVAQQ
jgi:hypothetical protein